MNIEIENLIKKYHEREVKLAHQILELSKLDVKTPKENNDLNTYKTIKVFWSIVIQDLKKIVDKS